MTQTLRVLVVEDEMLMAMLVEDMLQELGHVAVGPAARLDAGIRLASEKMLDLAILDVNLGNATSFPIADALTARGVPVVFATGYGINGLDERFSGFPVIAKPFSDIAFKTPIQTARTKGEEPNAGPPA